MTKTEMHDELNKAFANLIHIAYLLGSRTAVESLKDLRSFMSGMIDRSENKNV
jgi:hypothetical protein